MAPKRALRPEGATDECLRYPKEFRSGIVYAIRILPKDLPRMYFNDRKSVLFIGRIPPQRIIAKALLSPSLESLQWGKDPKRLGFLDNPNGLGAQLLAVSIAREYRERGLPSCPEKSAAETRFRFLV